jgi:hypothetical protein
MKCAVQIPAPYAGAGNIWVGMKRSFKPGQPVYHQRLGRGVVVEEWGAWVDVDDGCWGAMEQKTGLSGVVHRCSPTP